MSDRKKLNEKKLKENVYELVKKEKRHALVPLTQEEWNAKAVKAADLDLKLTELEKEKKDFNDAIGAKIKNVECDRRAFSKEIRERKEWRDVECLVELDFEASKVLYKFREEVVQNRDMTDDDKQLKLNLDIEDKDAEKKAIKKLKGTKEIIEGANEDDKAGG